MLRLAVLVATLWPLLAVSEESPCRRPRPSTTGTVATVTFDPATKLYTYRYEATKAPRARSSVTSPDPPAIVDVDFPPGTATRTVGPKALPDNANAEILLARLQDYLWESFRLCWITDSELFHELTITIEGLDHWLERNSPSTVRLELDRFAGALKYASPEKRSEEANGLLSSYAEMIRDRISVVPPPPLRNVKVEATVSFDPATKVYTYRYRISNPLENLLSIYTVHLDITLPPDSIKPEGPSKPPAGRDFEDPAQPFPPMVAEGRKTKSEAEFYRQGSGLDYIPVGLFTPASWHSAGIGPGGEADLLGKVMSAYWFGSGPMATVRRLLPGETLDGFVLTSFGPPGIRVMELQPWEVDLIGQLPLELWTSEGDSSEELHSKDRAVKCYGLLMPTLGPTAPPMVHTKLDDVKRLGGLVEECRKLSWISDGAFAEMLTGLLNEARMAIEKNDVAAARSLLARLANAVTSASWAQRTPEALDLLSLNALYLLQNWEVPVPRGAFLSPATLRRPVNTTQTMSLIVASGGRPDPSVPVSAEVLRGPHRGRRFEGKTDQSGKWTFSYEGETGGVDQLRARVGSCTPLGERESGSGAPPEAGNFRSFSDCTESNDAYVEWSGSPDLRVTRLRSDPLFIHVPSSTRSVKVDEMTANVGDAPAPASTTRYLLSSREYYGPLAVVLGEREVPPLEPEDGSRFQGDFVLPQLAPGYYTVSGCANARVEVAEEHKEDKCLSSAAPMFGIGVAGDCSDARATITPSASVAICPGGSVTLTASEGISYEWSSGGTSRSIVVDTVGYFWVTIVNSVGCPAKSRPVEVVIGDVPAPTILSPVVTPIALWPPDGRMVDVRVEYALRDSCVGPTTAELAVSSNDPAAEGPQEKKDADWEIIDSHRIRLRAARSTAGRERVYTVTILAWDGKGDASRSSVPVVVAPIQ